jgi:iron-regulated transporter 1
VVVSCVGFLIMLRYKRVLQHNYASIGFLVGLSVFACVEKVSSVLNTISVERDWVVIVANGHDERLRCKLCHPNYHYGFSMLNVTSTQLPNASH